MESIRTSVPWSSQQGRAIWLSLRRWRLDRRGFGPVSLVEASRGEALAHAPSPKGATEGPPPLAPAPVHETEHVSSLVLCLCVKRRKTRCALAEISVLEPSVATFILHYKNIQFKHSIQINY